MVSRRFVLLIIIVSVRKFISFNPQLFISSSVTAHLNKRYFVDSIPPFLNPNILFQDAQIVQYVGNRPLHVLEPGDTALGQQRVSQFVENFYSHTLIF